jgi:hypothetical protein
MGKKWLPLESNPEVMGSFAHTCVLAVLALSPSRRVAASKAGTSNCRLSTNDA